MAAITREFLVQYIQTIQGQANGAIQCAQAMLARLDEPEGVEEPGSMSQSDFAEMVGGPNATSEVVPNNKKTGDTDGQIQS